MAYGDMTAILVIAILFAIMFGLGELWDKVLYLFNRKPPQ